MQPVLDALADQHAELAGLLEPLDADDWRRPSPCEGWDVSDVVLHLALTDELAAASARGAYAEVLDDLTRGLPAAADVDEGAGLMVDAARGAPADAVHARWRASAHDLEQALAAVDPSTRVPWVAGELAARTLTTTRLAEGWIHTTDVAAALDVDLAPTDRLWHIARLAWRTLPYAFARAGRPAPPPVAFHLTGPGGDAWHFDPDEPPAAVVQGPAVELCLLAGQRRHATDTTLQADGPAGAEVLELVRTFA